MDTSTPLEHGRGRLGATLHERRWRLVLCIVLVEGILVLFDAIPWWTVLALAAVAFVFYVGAGRGHRSSAVHEGSWIAAVSQLVVVLVPALALVLTTLAVIAIVVVAVAALALVVLDRR